MKSYKNYLFFILLICLSIVSSNSCETANQPKSHSTHYKIACESLWCLGTITKCMIFVPVLSLHTAMWTGSKCVRFVGKEVTSESPLETVSDFSQKIRSHREVFNKYYEL